MTTTTGDMTVFWILIPAFAAVGLYLVWYTRRIRNAARRFAQRRHLPFRAQDDGQVEAILNKSFALEGPGRVRTFGRCRNLVTDGRVVMLHTVELLDLNAYASSQSPHHARVGVTFPAPPDLDAYLMVSPGLDYRALATDDAELSPDDLPQRVIAWLRERRPPHALSLTIKRGRALLYLEPVITGSVSQSDLDYLFDLARHLYATWKVDCNRLEETQAPHSPGLQNASLTSAATGSAR